MSRAMSASDFYLLPPEKQLPYFLNFLRNGKSKDKSPFPCKVNLRGRGTVALGSTKNTITGVEIRGEFIIINLKNRAWGQQKYEVLFHAGKAYCRIPTQKDGKDIPGIGINPEFTIEV